MQYSFLFHAPEGMLGSQINMAAVVSNAKEIKWWYRSCSSFIEIRLFSAGDFDNSKCEHWHLSPKSVIMKPNGNFPYLEIFAQFKLLLYLLLIYVH